MADANDGVHVPTEEEVIMATNSDVVSSLSDALGNVDAEHEKEIWLILDQIRKHADLILEYSKKLIQSQRVDIRSIE